MRKTASTIKLKHLGDFYVTSGQVMLVDPSFVLPKRTYSRLLNEWDKIELAKGSVVRKEKPAVQFNITKTKWDKSIVATTEGDDFYPVYARFNRRGRATHLVVELAHVQRPKNSSVLKSYMSRKRSLKVANA